jgi:acetyl-CoA carboxylase biotin carboxyl carrier protein
LSPGAFIGRLRVLNSYHDLYLPKNVRGKITVDEKLDNIIPVEYRQELFHLSPEQLVGADADIPAENQKSAITADADDGYVVTAFTTGIFYMKPSPDAPPFVEVGQKIEKGKALGLIEVMKTFNRIIFHGTNNSETGTIKKVYVKDSEEVKSGQSLFLIV